jgi:hypothetical protein
MDQPKVEFGTLYKVKNRPGRIDVVVNIQNDREFTSQTVYRDSDGKAYLRMLAGGTMTLDLVDEVVGKMSIEEMISAVQLGFPKESVQRTVDWLRVRERELRFRER